MTARDRSEPAGPRFGIGKLLRELRDELQAAGAVLHRLSLTTGSFERHDSSIGRSALPAVRWEAQLSAPQRVEGISFATADVLRDGHIARVGDSNLIPVLREDFLIAFLEIVSPRRDASQLPRWALDEYRVRVSHLLEQRFILRLLDNMQVPIEFTQDWESWLVDGGDLLELSTHMEFIALREVEGNESLTALLVRGFPPSALSDYNITAKDPHWTHYWKALQGETLPTPSVDLAGLQSIHKFAPDVRSFVVCPITVGGERFGCLSFGASCEYQFSSIELRGLEALSQGMGISVSNFRNYHEKAAAIRDESAVSVKVTAYEVAQSARHEARAVLGSLQDTIVSMGTELESGKVSLALELLNEIDSGLQKIDDALDKIRDAGSARRLEVHEVRLSELWNGARNLTNGRLNSLRVKAEDLQGSDLLLRVPPDWMREVFVHLLLNSLDAYKEMEHKNARRRRITLRVERFSERDEAVSIFYTDNAGGLRVSKIRSLVSRLADTTIQNVRPEEAIFMRDFTTKDTGSGHGLYVTRRILRDHAGRSSIDYVSTLSDSAQFRILLNRSVVVG